MTSPSKKATINNIPIDKLRDIIVVELYDGKYISKSSRFYCGCCGEVLGISKKRLCFPFSFNQFAQSLKNKTFERTTIGIYHKTCGHTMFGFKNGYNFISLEDYLNQSKTQ